MKKRVIQRGGFFVIVFSLTMTLSLLAQGDNRPFELGIRNYNKAHYRKARSYFEEALKSGPKDERLKFIRYAIKTIDNYKSQLYDIEKNEILFRRGTSDEYLRDSLSKKHLLLAIELMRNEFYLPLVEPHLKRAIGLDEKNEGAYVIFGNAYYTSMRYAKAIECYEKALSLNSANLFTYKMAGDASVAIGDFDKAKKFYTDLIRANEDAVLRYEPSEIEKVKTIMKILPETYKEVDSLLKDERTGEAEDILKKRISLNQADYIAITTLGNIYQDRGDRKQALRLFKNAIKIAPDYPIAHLYLGRLYYLMRKPDEAISELNIFKAKMKLLPKMADETKEMYINSLYYLSEVYFNLKKYEDARKEIEEILKLDPKQQAAHYNLGIYYYIYEHNRSRAYQSFMKSMELDPATDVAKSAKYAIEFMRANPDPRITPDFSFINQEYRE